MISTELNGSEVRTLTNQTTGSKLNVIAANGMVFSSWRFSQEELNGVKEGKPVWVIIRGELIPEFHLQVGDRYEVVPPEIIKRAKNAEAILSTPLGEQVVSEKKKHEYLVEFIAYLYLLIGVSLVGFAVFKILKYIVVTGGSR
jgi:hypothetical protein